MTNDENPRRKRTPLSSPPALAPARWRARLANWRTSLFRVLLVLLIVSHYVLLVVVLLRSIDEVIEHREKGK